MQDILGQFVENFAEITSRQVIEQGRLEQVYEIAMGQTDDNAKMVFHAAYVLEYVYFNDNSAFREYQERFIAEFTESRNQSARRHFAKIAFHLLKDGVELSQQDCQRVATTCVEWITEPRTKVAVQIWAMEILVHMRSRVEWLSELIPEIIESLKINPTPAIENRIRRWQKQLR